jgi:FSR family fosmidomycin resistance protein-like MFS transporter
LKVSGERLNIWSPVLRNRALSTLMLGHFSNDLFAGVLPMLYPAMKGKFDVSNGEIGLATLAYTGMASICQPFFGHLADRHDRRWYVPFTLVWSGIFVAAYGFAGSLSTFILLAGLAGLGSGAFHPLGATSAAKVVSERTKNTALSVYTVAGSFGYALGPLIAVVLLSMFGLHGTVFFVAWGVVAAAMLYRHLAIVQDARRSRALDPDAIRRASRKPNYSVLARVVLVVMLRSWVFLTILQFIPIWFDELGYRRAFYGPLATTIILAGAVGTLIGGSLADRIGGRSVVVGSLLMSIPVLLLFGGFPGQISFLIGAVFGLLSDSSLAVTLVAAQRLLPGKTGIASGLILGLGFVTGGLGVPVSGFVADRAGFETAFVMLAGLTGAAVLVALSIPKRALDFQDEPDFADDGGGRFQSASATQPVAERAS